MDKTERVWSTKNLMYKNTLVLNKFEENGQKTSPPIIVRTSNCLLAGPFGRRIPHRRAKQKMYKKKLTLTAAFLVLCFHGTAASLLKPSGLKCDSLIEPLGIDSP